MVDINDRDEVFKLLEKLKETDLPIFGIMTPQHMVEHLSFAVSYSNGTKKFPLMLDSEKAKQLKDFTVLTGKEFSPGFKSPLVNENLPDLRNNSLTEAIAELMTKIKLKCNL